IPVSTPAPAKLQPPPYRVRRSAKDPHTFAQDWCKPSHRRQQRRQGRKLHSRPESIPQCSLRNRPALPQELLRIETARRPLQRARFSAAAHEELEPPLLKTPRKPCDRRSEHRRSRTRRAISFPAAK